MKLILAALSLSVAFAAPLAAQEADVPDRSAPEVEEAVPLFDLFERLLQGFLTEVEPQMRELERGFAALEPDLQRLLDEVRGLTQYHPPEVLPNGDILIRRRQAADPEADAMPEDGSEPSTPEAPFEL